VEKKVTAKGGFHHNNSIFSDSLSARAILVSLVLLLALMLLLPLPVSAQSRTIIVPDNYPSIYDAVGNASSGDTVLVRSGTYLEHSIVINKSIKLEGQSPSTTVIKDIDPPSPLLSSSIMVGPTAITIGADNVVVSGFTIENAGYDIGGGGVNTLIKGNNLLDEIWLNRGSYQTVALNNLTYLRTDAAYTFVANNTFSGSGAFMTVSIGDRVGADNSVVYGNTIINDNSTWAQSIWLYQVQGVLVTANKITNSRAAIVACMSNNNIIARNTVVGGFIGLSVFQGGYHNTFYANNVEYSSYATAFSGLNDTVYDNNFIGNVNEIGSPNLLGGPNSIPTTLWFSGKEGNYWSKYLTQNPNATQIGNSNVGNIPYVIDANNTDPYPLISPYDTTNLPISLPSWVNLSLTNKESPPSFPPAPSSSPSPTPSPTPTPSECSTPSPEATPPDTKPKPFPTALVASASGASVAIIGAVFLLYLKKRKH
jgi:parallel beta-helix repeat protein